MNLSALFKKQKELDEHIVSERNLEGVDLLDKKILSLQVELGELANELPEEFKFWSSKKNNYKNALIEYCDCLHFILSIGNELGVTAVPVSEMGDYTEETITGTFIEMFSYTSILRNSIKYFSREVIEETYEVVFNLFVELGGMLGFTWDEIEQAYYKKNKINHERQESGY